MKYQLKLVGEPTGKLGFPPQAQVWESPRKFTKKDVENRKTEFLQAIVEKFATSKGMQKYIKISHVIITTP